MQKEGVTLIDVRQRLAELEKRRAELRVAEEACSFTARAYLHFCGRCSVAADRLAIRPISKCTLTTWRVRL
ncbi:hypothetical protein [Paraburkholderia flagellata]|uniref:hypothetical protein n=1 Tax=Paraburkholderia flagellata TaxID=2883241 RepID=UPI001F198D99|nr:hypothetical protein [Paraburkholderia flagellata]